MRLLGVTLGSNCQQFFGPDAAGSLGFVMIGADGQAELDAQPHLTLPAFNPAVSGLFPVPGGFGSVLIANGSDPQTWYALRAPSSGTLALMSVSGQWMLQDPSTVSGTTAPCSSGTTAAKVNLTGCVDTGTVDGLGNPIYAIRKLAVADQKVVIGDVDPITGVVGFKCLPANVQLKHPIGNLSDFHCSSFTHNDPTTLVDEAGGMVVQPQVGSGAITDANLGVYSPTTKRFYRAPARTNQNVTLSSTVGVTQDGTYQSMGGHAKFTNQQFNYGAFFISAVVRLLNDAADYTAINFALFIDGVNVNTWNVKGSTDNTLSHLHTGLAIGLHTVEIKVSQDASAGGNISVTQSDTAIFSIL